VALPPVTTMESLLLALPLIGTTNYANFSKWHADISDSLLDLVGLKPSSSVIFVFNQSVLTASLSSGLYLTADQSIAANNYFTALQTAIVASSCTVKAGTYIGGSATPSNTWSAAATGVPDPASLTAAKTAAVTYLSTTPLSGNHPTLATAVSQYLKTLTYTVTGVDSNSPPAPLVAPNLPVF
jgi:hypothetical protein